MKSNYDVVIIGAGVTGCAIAREVSKYNLSCCVLEKEEDVCSGTSKANSAIVHAGYDATPGSLKAKFNVEGNALIASLSKTLDFPFQKIGSLVLCFSEDDLPKLNQLLEKGITNGVPDLKLLTREEVLVMEPHITEEVVAALYAPTGGIVCPFHMTIAFAENAYENGVEFFFHTKVHFVKKEEDRFTIQTSQGDIKATYVVNAAGIYGDQISNGINSTQYEIIPRRGEYCLLDKEAGNYIHHTIFQLPGKYGKGILLTPTVHGNLLVGPTANDIEDKEDIATTSKGIEEVISKASKSIQNIPFRQTITSFAGLRAHEKNNDFVIKEEIAGFINAIGIESPGLTCAPAIGLFVAQLIADKTRCVKKDDFKAERKGILNPDMLSKEERRKLIQNNPSYGLIVCRCENVSEGEILDAIRRPLGATSLDGIKRRVRQGMGRCQAGFCTPHTIDLLAKELQIPVESVCKNTTGSNLLMEVKEVGDEK